MQGFLRFWGIADFGDGCLNRSHLIAAIINRTGNQTGNHAGTGIAVVAGRHSNAGRLIVGSGSTENHRFRLRSRGERRQLVNGGGEVVDVRVRVPAQRQLDGRVPGQPLHHLCGHPCPPQAGQVGVPEGMEIGLSPVRVAVRQEVRLFPLRAFLRRLSGLEPGIPRGCQIVPHHLSGLFVDSPQTGPQRRVRGDRHQPGAQQRGKIRWNRQRITAASLFLSGLNGDGRTIDRQVERFRRQAGQLARSQSGPDGCCVKHVPLPSRQPAAVTLILRRLQEPTEFVTSQFPPLQPNVSANIGPRQVRDRIYASPPVADEPPRELLHGLQIMITSLHGQFLAIAKLCQSFGDAGCRQVADELETAFIAD
ncbi:hypothetical protein SH412_002962 [Planctellipticum variicoloris]|nr:hypothetical protein SH412_002962 [Planctomycetaceae bacterium SH412]